MENEWSPPCRCGYQWGDPNEVKKRAWSRPDEEKKRPTSLENEILRFHEKWTTKSGWISINKFDGFTLLLSGFQLFSFFFSARSSLIYMRSTLKNIAAWYINCHEFEDLMSKIMAHIFSFRHIGFEYYIFFNLLFIITRASDSIDILLCGCGSFIVVFDSSKPKTIQSDKKNKLLLNNLTSQQLRLSQFDVWSSLNFISSLRN